jgi:microcystin-dependent protein
MSISFRRYFVARPSVAPTSSTTGGTFQVATRRINLDGQRTELSPIRTGVSLPATITPQAYSDTDAFLRNEILVSTNGTTWKIAPAPSNTGAQLIPAYSAAWPDTTINSNQAATGFALNFGQFAPGQTPEQTVYLVNLAQSINSLTFSFTDQSGTLATALMGHIQIDILGVFQALGSSADLSFNQSLIWDNPAISLNTIRLLSPQFSFIKARIKLVDYPLGALPSQAFNLSMGVQINRTLFPLTYPNQWPDGTFLIDDDTPFRLPLIETVTNTLVRVRPFMVNKNGVLRTNLQTRDLTFEAGARQVVIDAAGIVSILPGATVPPADNVIVATFTLSATTPFITNLVYPWAIKPQAFISLSGTSTLPRARFANLQSNGTLALATTAQTQSGITLAANSPLVATQGIAWLEVGGTVAVGDRLVPGANGRGIVSTSGGVAIALESGSANSIIKVGILSTPVTPSAASIDNSTVLNILRMTLKVGHIETIMDDIANRLSQPFEVITYSSTPNINGYWIPLRTNQTIGSAASGATIAQAWTQQLYTQLWNAGANTTSPPVMLTSAGGASTRGATAAADYAANKRLTLPNFAGRAPIGAGTGASLTARPLNSTGGAETHALTSAENGPHTHTLNDTGHSHGLPNVFSSNGGAPNAWTVDLVFTPAHSLQTVSAAQTTGITMGSSGSGTAHNNMQPWIATEYQIFAGFVEA